MNFLTKIWWAMYPEVYVECVYKCRQITKSGYYLAPSSITQFKGNNYLGLCTSIKYGPLTAASKSIYMSTGLFYEEAIKRAMIVAEKNK